MKPHPRIRKTIKWGGAAVTVLLVVEWVGSGWIWVGRTSGSYSCALLSGCLTLKTYSEEVCEPNRKPVWDAGVVPASLLGAPIRRQWWFSRTDELDAIRYAVPLWLPAIVSLSLTTAAWYPDYVARRRAKLNLCPKCGYDRTGLLQDAKCPECGAVLSSS